MTAETNFTRAGDVNIAYQVYGSDPRDLVVVPGWQGPSRRREDPLHRSRRARAQGHRRALAALRGGGLSARPVPRALKPGAR